MHVVTHIVSMHDPQCASTTRMQDPKCALPACTSQRVSIRVREPVRVVHVGHLHPALVCADHLHARPHSLRPQTQCAMTHMAQLMQMTQYMLAVTFRSR